MLGHLLHGDDRDAVIGRELRQRVEACRGAVVVEDLADHRAGRERGEHGKVDGWFGMAAPLDEGNSSASRRSAGQRAGWVLGGINNHGFPSNPSVPAGYDHQVEGECRIPGKTPTTHKTWGAVKALYR